MNLKTAERISGIAFLFFIALFIISAPVQSQTDKDKDKEKDKKKTSTSQSDSKNNAPAKPPQPHANVNKPTEQHSNVSGSSEPSHGGATGNRSDGNAGRRSGGATGSQPGSNQGQSGGGAIGNRSDGNAGRPSGGMSGNRPDATMGKSGGGIPQKQPPIFRPRPNIQTTTHADGTHTHVDRQTNTTIHTDRGGHITTVERPRLRASGFREDGRAAHIEHSRPDGSRMVVERTFRGGRRVEVVRRDGVRVITMGRHGFVERPYRPGYVSRTYVIGGRTEVRVYRTHTYGSIHYYTYVPRVYYPPAFYAWAYRPWGAPVVYVWGWGNAPWFYGGYFAPEPVYPTAALWLTDYLLAENLRLAYENRMAADGEGQQTGVAQNSSVTLTPEVKQMIAEEVRQQLAAEQAVAAQPASSLSSETAPQSSVPETAPPALDPKLKIFVVSTSLNATGSDDSQMCDLTPGDIIERTSRTVTDDGKVAVTVLNSKEGDCPVDFATTLDVSTLQDMHNQFREQISAGMEKLAGNQGKDGLPTGPAGNPRQVAEGQAPAYADAKDLLAKQSLEADQTESDTSQAANGEQ